MQVQRISEFKKLFREFKETFVDTSQGQEYAGFYERDRQQGIANFQAVHTALKQNDIASHTGMTDELTHQILRTLLPYSDTPAHREGGYWIHRAPVIQGDIKDWHRVDRVQRDWKAISHAIFHFIESCLEYPDHKKLTEICNNFSNISYVNNFQSEALTPILNSLSSSTFLLINEESQKTINYFLSKTRLSTGIKEYSSINHAGKKLIQKLTPTTREIWDSSLLDTDKFDMFCHWLVSIRKFGFMETSTQYWKIAPGDNAWQWEECREQGFISIGWDSLGDISGLDDSEFEARRDEVMTTHTDWSKAGVNQVWKFSQIKMGARIVANRGTREVVGIGTVTGKYYYQSDAERHKHRLPVEWDDTVQRSVYKPSWVKTLIPLNSDEFRSIVNLHPSGEKFDPSCPFSPTTFDLLSKLHDTPQKTAYDDHKQDFKTHLESPFQRLFLDVASQLPISIREAMETRHRIFGRILKNDFGQGGAYEHYWGAFYPKGSTRTEGAQLILIVGYDRLTFGFDIGQYSSQQRERFLTNCHKYHEDLLEILEPSLNQPYLRFGDRGKISFDSDGIAYDPDKLSFREWLKNMDSSGVHVFTTLSKANVLSHSRGALQDEICRVFSQLFPLVLLATLDDPMPSLQEYLDPVSPAENTNETFTLAQCAADTFLNEKHLQTWADAIKRKGQAILYGPPGTGKTFLAEHLTRHLLSDGDGFSSLVQFHPAYTYEDFIQGIRPQQSKHGGLDYPIVPGRFLKFCEQARNRQDTCVLIIDEINRANLAQVFGELMYLLEYRDHAVELATSGQTFSIPGNVRIISTMNTADRSIALVDHALRRRFAFLPLYPDMNILRKYHEGTGFAVEGLVQVLEQVNGAIGDRQYQLGTSFFLRKALEVDLKAIWQMEIEPYLEEYFFDRIGQVDNFRWARIQNQVL